MKYRILEDHAHWNGTMRYIPQVLKEGKWTSLSILGHEHFDTAKDIIAAHQKTGTPCSVVWTDDEPQRKEKERQGILEFLGLR